jgi:CRP-like cAMP-binding protein
MFEPIRAYLERNFTVTEDDLLVIRSVFVAKTLRKGDFLQREGEMSRYGAFVCKGFLRSYVIDDKGKEHIMQFAPENWWISDKSGLSGSAPSSFFIDAIEDSELLLVDAPGHLTLLEKVPAYAASFQAGIQKRAVAKDNRIVASLTATAAERYNEFLASYPTIAQQVPLHMLASYLGIAPETLSRIRKQASRKK